MNVISSLAGFAGTIFTLGIFLADVLIAIGIYKDASLRINAGKKVVVLSPVFWSVVSLFTSLAGLALYWLAHYSTFAKSSD